MSTMPDDQPQISGTGSFGTGPTLIKKNHEFGPGLTLGAVIKSVLA